MPPSRSLTPNKSTTCSCSESQSALKDFVPIDAQHGTEDEGSSPPVLTATSPKSVGEGERPSPSRAGSPSHKTSLNLETCTEVQYENRDGVHGISYRDAGDGEQGWTPVVGKRKKRCVPYFIRQRFPRDHPIHQENPSSDSDSGSDLDLDEVIPSGVADIQYKIIDGKPGLSVSTHKTHAWTTIAARTRARMANIT